MEWENLMMNKFTWCNSFDIYKSENLMVSISKTTFKKLKPLDVELMSASKYLPCICDMYIVI